ncbi:MAG: hypothetical protein ACOX6Y_05500 [Christensenellales bacterium]
MPVFGTFVLGVPGVMGVLGSIGTLGSGRGGIFPGSSGNFPGSIGSFGIFGIGVGVGVIIGNLPGSIGIFGIFGKGVGVIIGNLPGSIGVFGSFGKGVGVGVMIGNLISGIFMPGLRIPPAKAMDAVRVINSSTTNNRDNTLFIIFTFLFLFGLGFILVSTLVSISIYLPSGSRPEKYPFGWVGAGYPANQHFYPKHAPMTQRSGACWDTIRQSFNPSGQSARTCAPDRPDPPGRRAE